MPEYGDRYVVNQTYRSSSDNNKDQFQKWLNGPVDTGIRNSGGIRAIANPETKEREFFALLKMRYGGRIGGFSAGKLRLLPRS